MPGQPLRRESTNHPFVVKNKNICGGSPIIEGTRTRVIDIAIEYEILGCSPDEIINSHPYLNLPRAHDALFFYYENRNELDQKAEQDYEFIGQLKKKILSKIPWVHGKNQDLYEQKRQCRQADTPGNRFTGRFPETNIYLSIAF